MARVSVAKSLAMMERRGPERLDDAAEPRTDHGADYDILAGNDADWRALLLPLTQAQDALARLGTAAATASAAVRAGLLARVALHEAAGWLAHSGRSVSAADLALRHAGLVGA